MKSADRSHRLNAGGSRRWDLRESRGQVFVDAFIGPYVPMDPGTITPSPAFDLTLGTPERRGASTPTGGACAGARRERAESGLRTRVAPTPTMAPASAA